MTPDPRRCPSCDRFHLADPSVGFQGRPCYLAELLLPEIQGVTLSASDRAMLGWFASMLDAREAQQFAELLRRVREAGAASPWRTDGR